MSLRCLVIGDNHMTASNVVETDIFIEKITTASRRLKPDFIVCLGDLMDKHELAHMNAHVRACQFLEKLASQAPTFLLIGNHDRMSNTDFQSSSHFFLGMKHCPNLTIVETATKAQISSRKDPSITGNFLFVPYVAPGRFAEALDTVPLEELGEESWRSKAIDAIFAHQEFKGVQLGPIKSEHGDDWDASFPLVISGHIHDYQVLGSNLIYVGTPMQHTFSESPNKAVALFDFNTQYCEEATIVLEEAKSLEALVADPYVKCRYARIQLGLPVKRTLHISALEAETFQPVEGEKVKLVIHGSDVQLQALAKAKILNRLGRQGVKTSLIPDQTSASEKSSSNFITRQTPKTFLEALHDNIKDDTDLLRVYENIFSSKAVKEGVK